MVGSPNYVRFVYEGDGADSDPAAPPGSPEIEDIFTGYFDSEGLASDPTPFRRRSDYGPFIAVGIPAGGLFTGAESTGAEAQEAVYGGTAGVAYDSCCHHACGTISNVNTQALGLARSRSGQYDDSGAPTRTPVPASRFDHYGGLVR